MEFGVLTNGRVRTALTFVALSLCLAPPSAIAEKNGDTGQKADFRIPVVPLGYSAPNSFYLLSRLSSVSLDFIDKDHLLFTFRVPGLMARLPECLPGDEDQTIRAVVLELPEGKVVTKTDWRMHDRSRYLWRLSDGRFLVRQRSTLFATDKSLELEQYIHSESPLESIQISPDRKFAVIEAQGKKQNRETVASTVPTLGDAPPPESKPVQLFILRTDTRALVARSEMLNAIEIPMLGEGHVLSIAGKQNKWLVRYMPFQGEAQTLLELDSACHPSEEPVSKDVTLVMTCPRSGNDHLITALSLDGKKLWEQRWESRYIWPTFQLTQDGSRFAYSSLQVAHPVGTMDPVDTENITHQMVGVFDTQTGQLRLVKDATPILSAGQNYALSSDGMRFAILREGAIEIFNLPPLTAPVTPASAGAH